jgi:NADP oxidoreductase coenzyme F420-dependent
VPGTTCVIVPSHFPFQSWGSKIGTVILNMAMKSCHTFLPLRQNGFSSFTLSGERNHTPRSERSRTAATTTTMKDPSAAVYICHYYYHYIYCLCSILLLHFVTNHPSYNYLPSNSLTGVVVALDLTTFHKVQRGGNTRSRPTTDFATKVGRQQWKSSSSSSSVNTLLQHSSTSTSTAEIDIMAKNNSKVTIGVIGCGTIASAIVTGLAKYQQQPSSPLSSDTDGSNSSSSSSLHIERIVITKRSERKSTLLQSSYPNLVSVSESNQNVLDLADIIFITVLPNQTASVLQELQFTPQRHILISLVSTCSIDVLCTHSQLPIQQVYKMICLPGVQYNNDGICLLQIPSTTSLPSTMQHDDDTATKDANVDTAATSSSCLPLPLLMDLLGILGHVVTVTSDEQMSSYMVPTGLMGLFYGTLRTNRNWILQNDLPKATTVGTISDQQQLKKQKIATQLVLRCYNNMIQDAIRRLDADHGDDDTDLLEDLIHEQTSGGLNEQALANGMGIMNIYEQVQDAMLLRILGKSDGSMNLTKK